MNPLTIPTEENPSVSIGFRNTDTETTQPDLNPNNPNPSNTYYLKTDTAEAKSTNEDGKKFTTFNIAAIMNGTDRHANGTNELLGGTNELSGGTNELLRGTNELPGGSNELPGGSIELPARKRRMTLWARHKQEKISPDNVLTTADESSEAAEEEDDEEREEEVEESKSSQRETDKMRKFRMSRAQKREPTQFTVLNIPVPSAKRRQMSKIDLAVLRRQSRRLRGDVSDDSDDDGEEIDLWVTAGPPCRLDLTGGKAEFLDRFGLVSHSRRNCIEFRKLMKRKWLGPDVFRDTDIHRIRALDLPLPSKSQFGTNLMQNHKQKRTFLHVLGLSTVPAKHKREMEESWKLVVEERLRRNCDTPLTDYYQKAQVEVQRETNVVSLLPIVHQYKKRILPCPFPTSEKLPLPGKLLSLLPPEKLFPPEERAGRPGAGRGLPLTRVLDGNRSLGDPEGCKENDRKTATGRGQKFVWPGVGEIREAYVRYSREKSLEIAELRRRRFILADDNSKMQSLVKFLEGRQRTLHAVLFKAGREGRSLQTAVDQLTDFKSLLR